MSDETDADRQSKYNAMIQRVNANKSTNTGCPPLNMYSSRIGASHINSTQHMSNNTLSTHQFYGGQNPPLRQVEAIVPEPSCSGSTYAPSDASVFKLPNTTKKHAEWYRVESTVNNLIHGFRNSDFDKFFLKLWVRMSNEILSLANNHPSGVIDEFAFVKMVTEILANKYYSGRPPRSISSHSIISDAMSSSCSVANDTRHFNAGSHLNLRQAGNNGPFAIMENMPASSHPQIPDQFSDAMSSSCSVGNDNRHFNAGSHLNLRQARNNGPYAMMENMPASSHPQIPDQFSARYNPSVLIDRTTTTSSYQPQMSGNNCTQLSMRPPQPLEKCVNKSSILNTTENKKSRKVKHPSENRKGARALESNTTQKQPKCEPKSQLGLSFQNTSVIGARCVSRFGRAIKSPNQFWKGINNNPNELSVINNTRTCGASKDTCFASEDFSDTVILRNNKKVIKSTPLVKNTARQEQETKTKVKAGRPKKTTNSKLLYKENKENESVQDKESTKTQNTAPRAKEQQKKVQSKPKSVQRAPTKRKSKEPELTITKRQKIDEVSSDAHSWNSDSDDDLFQLVNFKKRPANQVLSPSGGLHSVKKAAAASMSKETPPAKFISQFMEPDVASAGSSKQLPSAKVPQVVKRVTKVAEKKVPMKEVTKSRQRKRNIEENPVVDNILQDIFKSSYTTPEGNVGLTVFRGIEQASDVESDFTEDEDNDLI